MEGEANDRRRRYRGRRKIAHKELKLMQGARRLAVVLSGIEMEIESNWAIIMREEFLCREWNVKRILIDSGESWWMMCNWNQHSSDSFKKRRGAEVSQEMHREEIG